MRDWLANNTDATQSSITDVRFLIGKVETARHFSRCMPSIFLTHHLLMPNGMRGSGRANLCAKAVPA